MKIIKYFYHLLLLYWSSLGGGAYDSTVHWKERKSEVISDPKLNRWHGVQGVVLFRCREVTSSDSLRWVCSRIKYRCVQGVSRRKNVCLIGHLGFLQPPLIVPLCCRICCMRAPLQLGLCFLPKKSGFDANMYISPTHWVIEGLLVSCEGARGASPVLWATVLPYPNHLLVWPSLRCLIPAVIQYEHGTSHAAPRYK